MISKKYCELSSCDLVSLHDLYKNFVDVNQEKVWEEFKVRRGKYMPVEFQKLAEQVNLYNEEIVSIKKELAKRK